MSRLRGALHTYKRSEQGRKLIKYTLDKIDNYFKQTDEHLIDFDRVNIEHILPQNPSKEWGLSKEDIIDYVNKLGNLTLLSKILNSKIQNGPIDKKLPELRKL
ncbi:MAG: HNH endonuclease family protein [Thermodesulfobacteriota bacterium]